jgi:hypothetical protein
MKCPGHVLSMGREECRSYSMHAEIRKATKPQEKRIFVISKDRFRIINLIGFMFKGQNQNTFQDT